MRGVMVGIMSLGLLGFGVAAHAAPPAQDCNVAMKSLGEAWDAAGFATPVKPGQSRVIGRNGREATAGQVNYMAGQIRHAARECAAGNNDAALTRISAVRSQLDLSTGASAPMKAE